MQKANSNWVLALFFILGVALGIILLLIFKKYTALTINNGIDLSINPLEVFSITVNVLLALFVTVKLSKRNEQEKFDKQVLVNSFDSFNKEVGQVISSFLEKDEYNTMGVRAKFKTLRIKLNSLVTIGEENNLLDTNDRNDLISIKMTELWELFTDSPQKPSRNSSKAVKEELEYIKLQMVSEIEKKHIEFEKEIFQIIFKISRS